MDKSKKFFAVNNVNWDTDGDIKTHPLYLKGKKAFLFLETVMKFVLKHFLN